jgi:UDP-N-acetylmuramoyl-L-alanyl-D-glutamate--2,6-diaminopimelate ligase
MIDAAPALRLSELLDAVRPLAVINAAADPQITSLANDSRKVTPGALFVAIPGVKMDGHRFISQAIEAGAAAVVCQEPPQESAGRPTAVVDDARLALSALADRFYGSPSRHLRMTGITGTDGKTSTTELLRTILNESGSPAGSVGTLGFCLGGRWLDSDLTTPDPIALHGAFRRMVDVGLSDACMEVSSHSLLQQRVAHVNYDVAILTNITRDHLDTHGTEEDYAAAKRRLFEELKEDSVAVLPADSKYCRPFMKATRAQVLTFGMQNLADVRGRVLAMGMDGMAIVVQTPFETYSVSTPLIGSYNCLNILAAATAAFAYGIGGEVVKEAMRNFRGVPGRLERIAAPGRSDLPGVCVDFAHTPDALEKVLSTLRPLGRGRLVCVIGCGGDRDAGKRPVMGAIAAGLADVAVLTTDNSRSERTEDILAQMLAGVPARVRPQVRVEPDRRRAMQLAVELAATPDSMVAVCGRGCERHLKLGGELIPFDDRVVAREIMEQMPLARRMTA